FPTNQVVAPTHSPGAHPGLTPPPHAPLPTPPPHSPRPDPRSTVPPARRAPGGPRASSAPRAPRTTRTAAAAAAVILLLAAAAGCGDAGDLVGAGSTPTAISPDRLWPQLTPASSPAFEIGEVDSEVVA